MINYRDQYENTPCHAAAEAGYSNVMRVLIKYGAIVGLKNDEEQTAMHKAAKFGQSNIIRQLHKRDDTLIGDWDENNDLPLHIAAVNGHKQCVKLLIELGSQVDERNTKGWTPLDCAAANGAYDVCQVLIDHDAPIDAMDRSGTTPLQLACRGGFEDVVQLLLDNNADCSIIDNTFSTVTSETEVAPKWQGGLNCLDYAIDYYHEEVVEVLLKSDQWEQCLENAYLDPNSGHILTPMRKLIKHLPNQAKIAFDRCVKIKANKNDKGYSLEDAPRKVFENKELIIKFNFNYLDDDYLVAEWGNASPDDASEVLSQSNEKTEVSLEINLIPDESIVKEPYDLKKKILIENHPLNYLISNNRQELISHPLVTALYNIKWNRLGFYVYYTNLAIYILFMVLLNIYALAIPPPYSYDTTRMGTNATNPCSTGEIPILEDAVLWIGRSNQFDCYKIPDSRVWVIWVIIVTACARMVFEISQMIHERIEYFLDFTNILEWALYVLTILFVVDINNVSGTTTALPEVRYELRHVIMHRLTCLHSRNQNH